MTVSSTTTKNSYSGDGAQTVFAYGFKIFDDDDIQVILRNNTTGAETVQTKTTHYSVSNVGNANGGNVTFVTAPTSSQTVVLIRAIPLTQATDYTPNDPFPAETHEEALDRLTFIVQDQQEELDRAIKISKTNTITSPEFTVGATTRANKIFAFDSSGDLSVTQEIGTYQGTDATTTTSAYSERDIIKSTTAAELNNVYICVADSVAGDLLTDTDHFELLVDAVSAATSATNAASSASAAATSATAAANSATAAATSESNAATSESNASTSETNAATSATSASTSATAASTAQTAAETAQTAAETAETNAETAETNAETAQTAAETAQTAAETAQTAAETAETNAATSATTATTKASEAATSATNAATSESNASTSETNAATSASAAATSATAAAASAASAASAFDNFDDTYLGAKASDPTVDNDGDPLTDGDLYFNTTANEMRVYDGAQWIAASAATQASLILYEYTATSGQTTFSGSDDNAATLSYTADNLQVVMNGIVLDPSDFTATNGTSVVLATGAAANDIVNIYAFQSFTVADTVSASAGGTFSGNVTVNARLDVDNIRIDGNTISSTDTNGDITLDPDGTGDTIVASGNVGIGTSSPNVELEISGSSEMLRLQSTDTNKASIVGRGASADRWLLGTVASNDSVTLQATSATGELLFKTGGTNERMRIASSGSVFMGKTSSGSANSGFEYEGGNALLMTRNNARPFVLNRGGNDGILIDLRQANNTEGTISVSGTTVSYNGGHLSRWSQATDGNRIDGLVKGTVMTNLDQMAVWSHDDVLWTADDDLPDGVSVGDVRTAAYTEDNEQLNCMAVSSVEGDANVAGVFVNWDNDDDDFNDMNIAMTGDMVIRIAQGTTVARGDLLMSAGDGTAKPQGDDIVRSKTIAKVTSTTVSHTYDDGSYLVPCVLMAC